MSGKPSFAAICARPVLPKRSWGPSPGGSPVLGRRPCEFEWRGKSKEWQRHYRRAGADVDDHALPPLAHPQQHCLDHRDRRKLLVSKVGRTVCIWVPSTASSQPMPALLPPCTGLAARLQNGPKDGYARRRKETSVANEQAISCDIQCQGMCAERQLDITYFMKSAHGVFLND